MSQSYVTGVGAGVLTALILLALITAFKRKTGRGNEQFDERQELVRGRGYKYAFFTVLLGICILYVSSVFVNTRDFYFAGMWVVMLAGVAVYAVYCIMNDAYFGIKSQKKQYILLMAAIAAINAVSAAVQIINEGFTDASGSVNTSAVLSIAIVAAFGAVLVALLVKDSRDKREVLEDEES